MENLIIATKKPPALPRSSNNPQKRAGMNIIKFVAILVILTIVARGVSGATLPTVSTASPSRGEIIQAVSGNAVVSSTDTVGIYAPEGLRIQEMLTGAGQTVDVNEPVALLDIDEIVNKLIRETASLDKMLFDLDALENVDTVDSTNLNNQQRYLNRAHEDYNLTKLQANTDIAAAQSTLDEALRVQADYLEKSHQYTPDNPAISLEGEATNIITNEPDPDITRENQAAVNRARDALAAAQRKAENDLLHATRRIEDTQASVQSASQDYSNSQSRRSETIEGNNISATTLQLDIETQELVVKKLRLLLENDGIIYSDIKGMVSAVKINGDTTGKDAILTIKDGAGGFEAVMFLDMHDSDMLEIGSECEVTTGSGTMFFNPTVTGIVSAISPPDDDDVVKVTIKLPPTDWTEGQRVDVTAFIDHSVHDMCLPLSALRSDNNGYFLLITEQRSTVLGAENLVDRVPVIVVASDRDTVSVQGPVSRNTHVITGSSKPISPGDIVRLS
jgi:multidrug efflux pump subunit AcrA (membrane-fusion protein)